MYPLSGLIGDFCDAKVMRPMLWEWVLKNWDLIYKRYLPTPSLLAAILQSCIRCNLGMEFVEMIQVWRNEGTKSEDLKCVSAKIDQVCIMII